MKKFLSVALAVAPLLASMAISADSAAPAASDVPTAAVTKFIDAFSGARASEIYSVMPASYRKDVVSIVSAFGNKMDPEIWKEGQSIIAEVADLAAVKSDLLAEAFGAQSTMPKAEIAALISQVAPEVKKLVTNVTLDAIKAGKVNDILSMPEIAAISKLTAKNLPAEAKIGLQSIAKDATGAVIAKIKNAEGMVEDTEFVNVEGAWIPKEMADGWKEGVGNALKAINSMKFDAAKKQQLLAMSPMIKGALAQAKSATTIEQLGQAVMMPVMMIAMMAQNEGGGTIVEEETVVEEEVPEAPAVAPKSAPSAQPIRQVPGGSTRTAPQPVMP